MAHILCPYQFKHFVDKWFLKNKRMRWLKMCKFVYIYTCECLELLYSLYNRILYIMYIIYTFIVYYIYIHYILPIHSLYIHSFIQWCVCVYIYIYVYAYWTYKYMYNEYSLNSMNPLGTYNRQSTVIVSISTIDPTSILKLQSSANEGSKMHK